MQYSPLWTILGQPQELVPLHGPETEEVDVDVDAFGLILRRSKSVCVWGEWYNKRKL